MSQQLTEDEISALQKNIAPSWYSALEEEFSKSYFLELSEFLKEERFGGKVYPDEDKVYSWTHYCNPEDVKVVILGQDPQPYGKAHGLAFSVLEGEELPVSLQNIYKALTLEIPGFTPPPHGHLRGWAEQGVLLLNVCLTVRANDPKSHIDQGWECFTDAVIRKICQLNKGVVFLLWGNDAQQYTHLLRELIPRENVFKSCHPTAPSYHTTADQQPKFHGNFSRCNARLVEQGLEPIDWNHLP